MASEDVQMETESPTAEPTAEAAQQNHVNLNKKRKIALFVAYLGAEYSGMQNNKGAKTIESTLEAAIVRAGGISKDNAGDFFKINWSRAARTDKGVNAVGQVVSLKMVVAQPDIVARINAELPEDIRVFGYKRVTGSFDARFTCDRRRYEYVLPAFAFDPGSCQTRAQRDLCSTKSEEAARDTGHSQQANGDAAGPARVAHSPDAQQEDCETAVEQSMPDRSSNLGEGEQVSQSQPCKHGKVSMELEPPSQADAQQLSHGSLDIPEEVLPATAVEGSAPDENGTPGLATEDCSSPVASSGYVFDKDQRQKLDGILRQFTGTHNFHNFATLVKPKDRNAKRYILSFQCRGTISLNGQTWVRTVVIGQSFMLNQIRKMVGLAVAMMRGLAPMNSIQLALTPNREVHTPVAPAAGLFLDECFFEAYNKTWGMKREEPLSLTDYADQILEFKEKKLYPAIAAQESTEQCTAQFVRSLSESAHYKFSSWESMPLQAPVSHRPKGRGPGGAVILGAQETYGVRTKGIFKRKPWVLRGSSEDAGEPMSKKALQTVGAERAALSAAEESILADFSEGD